MDQEPDELVADEVIEFEENSQTSIVVSDGSSTTLNKIKSLARNKKALAGVATAALLTAAASAAFILIHSPDVAEDGQATELDVDFTQNDQRPLVPEMAAERAPVDVAGYFKMQPYGPGRSLRREIYIDDHQRGLTKSVEHL